MAPDKWDTRVGSKSTALTSTIGYIAPETPKERLERVERQREWVRKVKQLKKHKASCIKGKRKRKKG